MEHATTNHEPSPYTQLLRVLGNALDLRDCETAGHSRRVARYCVEIGQALGCDAVELMETTQAAYVHDIGKIAIPDTILCKPGRLTPEEFDVMRGHAWIGYNLLSGFAPFAPIAEIILAHHERWDGRGYPRGLRGEEIPRGARTFAVADTLDSMTTDRPYRKAQPFSTGWAEIKRESGRQFDPEVAEAFLSIPEDVMRAIVLEEKRRSVRVRLDTMVKCGRNGERFILRAVNISEGGMLLGGACGIEINTGLHMEFCLPEAEIPLGARGRVIRKELPARVGVAFDNLTPDIHSAITEYVGQRIQI